MVRFLIALFAPPRLAFGGGGSTPPPPSQISTPPPPPMLQHPQGEAMASEARRRASAANGFGGTIITGPLGDLSTPNLGKKSLLGS